MSAPNKDLSSLDERSREIFKHIVDSFLQTGQPVGSRSLAQKLSEPLSPASVRNVMADLEDLGLITAPHTSAGRMPTQPGLRFFVDGLLQVGDLSAKERKLIEGQIRGTHKDKSIEDVLAKASAMLSGLSSCAGLVFAERLITRLKQIQFVNLDPGRGLVILVGEDGQVENLLIKLPKDITPSDLQAASNYVTDRLSGKTLPEAKAQIKQELKSQTTQLDKLTEKLVKKGIAAWSQEMNGKRNLIVRGRSNLIDDDSTEKDIEQIRQLFDDLETKNEMANLLDFADKGEGVHIFIGSENKLFSLSGSSMIAAPFTNADDQIVGALGIIGPTRLNYGRVIPLVDYTARLISKLY